MEGTFYKFPDYNLLTRENIEDNMDLRIKRKK